MLPEAYRRPLLRRRNLIGGGNPGHWVNPHDRDVTRGTSDIVFPSLKTTPASTEKCQCCGKEFCLSTALGEAPKFCAAHTWLANISLYGTFSVEPEGYEGRDYVGSVPFYRYGVDSPSWKEYDKERLVSAIEQRVEEERELFFSKHKTGKNLPVFCCIKITCGEIEGVVIRLDPCVSGQELEKALRLLDRIYEAVM